MEKKFDAFISYSHLDKTYASAIQKSIETLGLPFYKKWRSDVLIFRDERKIALSDSLQEVIIQGLSESKYLLVIASKNSANSKWVREEIMNWHKLNYDNEGYIVNFNFILIDDVVEWDYQNHNFDTLKTTALPIFETAIFKELPVWANVQHYCKKGKVDDTNANYEWEIAKVKGLLLNKTPDKIIDESSNAKRTFGLLITIVGIVLFLLTIFAFNERNTAIRERDIAVSRELILNAEKTIKSDPQLSLLLAIKAAEKQLYREGNLSEDMRLSLKRIIKVNSTKVPFSIRNNFGKGGVESFAISPDETQIALGSQNDTVWVLDRRTYKPLFTLKQDWPVGIEWSSDGRYLATAGQEDQSVKIWDARRGTLLKQFQFEKSGGVMSVDWRLHTHQLAFSVAMGDKSIVKIYDLDRDSTLFEIPGIRARWSNNGQKIATGGINDTSWSVRIYSANGSPLCAQKGHDRYVHDISWSPNDAQVATSSVDDKVIIWNAVSCHPLKVIRQNFSLSSAWSPDFKYLAVGGGEKTVKIYDVKNKFTVIDSIDFSTTITGDVIESSSIQGYVLNIKWSNDGTKLFLSDREGSITVYDVRMFKFPDDLQLITLAKDLKKRDLTTAEVTTYFPIK